MGDSIASDDMTRWLGRLMPHSYNGGYITLSYLVSLAGCWTALELLHKRTGAHGAHNWYRDPSSSIN